jgi:hypothetical protein
MTDDIDKTLEEGFILDFDRSLAVRARRNALLANWIAFRTGRTDTAALTAAVLKQGEADTADALFCDGLLADLRTWGIDLDSAELHAQAHALLIDAAAQLAAEDRAKPVA